MICPDCKGSGKYQGLTSTSACQGCGGTGVVADATAPAEATSTNVISGQAKWYTVRPYSTRGQAQWQVSYAGHYARNSSLADAVEELKQTLRAAGVSFPASLVTHTPVSFTANSQAEYDFEGERATYWCVINSEGDELSFAALAPTVDEAHRVLKGVMDLNGVPYVDHVHNPYRAIVAGFGS